MRRPGVLLFLLSALACGPTAAHRTEQALAPISALDSAHAPMVACVDAVLASSALVERVSMREPDYPRTRYVVLRNPPGQHTNGFRFSILPWNGPSPQLLIEYVWPGRWQGRNGMQQPPDERVFDLEGETLGEIGARLLSDVRSECAPSATGAPACSRVAQGQGGRCVLKT